MCGPDRLRGVAKDKKAEKRMDSAGHDGDLHEAGDASANRIKQFAGLAGSWTTKTKEWMEPGSRRQNPPALWK